MFNLVYLSFYFISKEEAFLDSAPSPPLFYFSRTTYHWLYFVGW